MTLPGMVSLSAHCTEHLYNPKHPPDRGLPLPVLAQITTDICSPVTATAEIGVDTG